MRFNIIIITALLVCFSGCRTLDMLTKKFSTLYTEKEQTMLEETTSAVDYKFGYDPDLDLDYVYKAGKFTDKEVNSRLPEMKKVLSKYPKEEVAAFYEKILTMKESQVWAMNRFRDGKKWTNYTYIQKYILPETEQYLGLLEKNVIQIDPQYGETIEDKKKEIKEQTVESLEKKQELHDKKLREERRPSWR